MANLPLTAPDLLCLDDLDLFGGEVASDLQALEQDVYHILIEAPGSNPDDVNRGIGIEELLSGPTTAFDGLTQRIESQLQKDDRIDTVKASLLQVPAGTAFPDGTVAASDGYLLELQIVATAGVLGLSYSFTGVGGLIAL